MKFGYFRRNFAHSCDGDDRRGQGMNASLCIGCTCKKEDNVNFYCDSN